MDRDKREKFLKELIERLLTSDVGFTVNCNGETKYFAQIPVGKVKMVYSNPFSSAFTSELKRFAIIEKSKIYLMSKYDLPFYADDIALPENVVFFNEYFADFAEEIFNDTVKKMYSKLPVIPLEPEDYESRKEMARRCLIFGTQLDEREEESVRSIYPSLKNLDIINALCEGVDLKEKAKEEFESRKENFLKIKSYNAKLKELIEVTPDLISEKWERELAKSLANITAKKVTVEFFYHGKTASHKMSPGIILGNLCRQDYFSNCDFTTSRNGDNIIKTLGAGKYRGDKNEVLTCKHIEKITYGRKVLYKKRCE